MDNVLTLGVYRVVKCYPHRTLCDLMPLLPTYESIDNAGFSNVPYMTDFLNLSFDYAVDEALRTGAAGYMKAQDSYRGKDDHNALVSNDEADKIVRNYYTGKIHKIRPAVTVNKKTLGVTQYGHKHAIPDGSIVLCLEESQIPNIILGCLSPNAAMWVNDRSLIGEYGGTDIPNIFEKKNDLEQKVDYQSMKIVEKTSPDIDDGSYTDNDIADNIIPLTDHNTWTEESVPPRFETLNWDLIMYSLKRAKAQYGLGAMAQKFINNVKTVAADYDAKYKGRWSKKKYLIPEMIFRMTKDNHIIIATDVWDTNAEHRGFGTVASKIRDEFGNYVVLGPNFVEISADAKSFVLRDPTTGVLTTSTNDGELGGLLLIKSNIMGQITHNIHRIEVSDINAENDSPDTATVKTDAEAVNGTYALIAPYVGIRTNKEYHEITTRYTVRMSDGSGVIAMKTGAVTIYADTLLELCSPHIKLNCSTLDRGPWKDEELDQLHDANPLPVAGSLIPVEGSAVKDLVDLAADGTMYQKTQVPPQDTGLFT